MEDLTTTELLQSDFAYSHGQISPDGRMIAYGSTEEGQEEIYVRSFPNVNDARVKVSRAGGFAPRWAGNELFYQSFPGGDRTAGMVTMMVAPVEMGGTINAGDPTQLFTGPYRSSAIAEIRPPTWDVSEDGQRFLMIKEPTGAAEGAPLLLVQNWVEELKRLVPVD